MTFLVISQILWRCRPKSFIIRQSMSVMSLFGPSVIQPVVCLSSVCQYPRCLDWFKCIYMFFLFFGGFFSVGGGGVLLSLSLSLSLSLYLSLSLCDITLTELGSLYSRRTITDTFFISPLDTTTKFVIMTIWLSQNFRMFV